ncbi:MAG: hypothetical protein ABIS18_11550 [Actinomycetota bacterium]
MALNTLPRRNLGLLLVVLAALLTACLKVPPPGVSVKAARANLAFGVPPIAEEAPPPGFEPIAVFVPLPSPRTTEKPTRLPPPPVVDCPTAPERTFPEEVATTDVTGHPKVGGYRWKLKGRFRDPVSGAISPLPPFALRAIGGLDLKGAAPDKAVNFSFSTGELEFNVDSRSQQGTGAFVVQKFNVVQTGSGDHGIFLTKILRYSSPTDRDPQEFNPEPAVMLTELPVKVPMTINSVGVDPDSLAALTVKGSLIGRKRVDVCGKIIDSWYYETEQQFTSATGANYTRLFKYSIATQFGGFIVFEDNKAPPPQPNTEPVLEYVTNIGAMEPQPLPDAYKNLFK